MTKTTQDYETGALYLTRSPPPNRDWWLVKASRSVDIGTVTLPRHFFGKKIRFKVEVIQESPLDD